MDAARMGTGGAQGSHRSGKVMPQGQLGKSPDSFKDMASAFCKAPTADGAKALSKQLDKALWACGPKFRDAVMTPNVSPPGKAHEGVPQDTTLVQALVIAADHCGTDGQAAISDLLKNIRSMADRCIIPGANGQTAKAEIHNEIYNESGMAPLNGSAAQCKVLLDAGVAIPSSVTIGAVMTHNDNAADVIALLHESSVGGFDSESLQSTFNDAVDQKNHSGLETLMDAGVDFVPNTEPSLYGTVKEGDTELIRLLSDRGYDGYSDADIMEVCTRGVEEAPSILNIVTPCLKDGANRAELLEMIAGKIEGGTPQTTKYEKAIEVLVATTPHPESAAFNAAARTVTATALDSGQSRLASIMSNTGPTRLDCTAVVIDKLDGISDRTAHGLLSAASTQGRADMASAILDTGLALNSEEIGRLTDSAIMGGDSSGHTAIFEKLMSLDGVDVNANSTIGPVLAKAAMAGNTGITASLLSREDIDVNLVNLEDTRELGWDDAAPFQGSPLGHAARSPEDNFASIAILALDQRCNNAERILSEAAEDLQGDPFFNSDKKAFFDDYLASPNKEAFLRGHLPPGYPPAN